MWIALVCTHIGFESPNVAKWVIIELVIQGTDFEVARGAKLNLFTWREM